MHRSRTPLDKWAAAIRLLSSTAGVNAVQLSATIGISYKAAWGMLRSIRRAIGALEAERPLQGDVCAGMAVSGRWHYQPFQLYPDERVVIVGASVDPETGIPLRLKLHSVSRDHLTDLKELTREGKASFEETHVHPYARFTFLRGVDMHIFNPIRERFEEARRWLNALFRGLSAASIQPFLDEYCFRFHAASSGRPLAESWLEVCMGRLPFDSFQQGLYRENRA